METGITPALIALDWGTSSLRAYLMDNNGRVLDRRGNPHGIQNLPVPGIAGFERVFSKFCADGLTRYPGLPAVAGGMVGSAEGGGEPPSVACRADTATLAGRAVAVESASG